MSEFSSNKVESALLKKGFRYDKDKTASMSHRAFYFYDLNGNKTNICTHLSHNSQPINDYLIGKMAKQLKLKNGQFKDMISCHISHEQYHDILVKKSIFFKIY